MAGEILTPSSIWSEIDIARTPSAQIIGEYKEGNVSLQRLRINGNDVYDGLVKIYSVIAKPVDKEKMPAIFILQRFQDGADENLAMDLAKRGYCAFVVQIGGDDGVNNNYTLYPESLSFADYKHAHTCVEDTTVNGDVKETCWYEWGVTARYAYKYLSSLPFVTKIAGLGIGDSATILWHMTATESFDCLAFVLNAGWKAYKGNHKFVGNVDEQFSDAKIKYLAGIEPQAYANLVKTPTFIATATNSFEFDFDRAHDTYARISDKVKTVINYTLGGIDCVDFDAYENLNHFFSDVLLKKEGDKSLYIPSDPTVKCDEVNGKLQIEVKADTENLKSVCLYVAEEKYAPYLRQWQKLSQYTKKGEAYLFEHLPYHKSGCAFFFVSAVYKNGYVVNSDIICKKFSENDIMPTRKSKIIYSSRDTDSITSFYPACSTQKKPHGLNISEDNKVAELFGAMDIKGATCENGLLSFKIGMQKYRPNEDGLLLVDVYIKQGGNLTVKLIGDYYGARTEYQACVNVSGGEVWHNVKLPLSAFKTKEGMAIRSVEKLEALEINADKKYLVNNVLWV